MWELVLNCILNTLPLLFFHTCSDNFYLKSTNCCKNCWKSPAENVLLKILGNWGPERLVSYSRSHSESRTETEIQGSWFSSQNSAHYPPNPLWYFYTARLYPYSLYKSRVITGTHKWFSVYLGELGSAPVHNATSPLSSVKPFGLSFFRIHKDPCHCVMLFTQRGLDP